MLVEDTDKRELLIRTDRHDWELKDKLFIIQLLSSPSAEKLQSTATVS